MNEKPVWDIQDDACILALCEAMRASDTAVAAGQKMTERYTFPGQRSGHMTGTYLNSLLFRASLPARIRALAPDDADVVITKFAKSRGRPAPSPPRRYGT